MIDIDRLRDIEAAARSARTLAAERFRGLGVPFERICDVSLAGMVLTWGTVDPMANLTRSGERLAGVMEGNPAAPTILYEQYDPPARQRFSIAHELGHFYLHRPAARPHASGAPMAYHRCVQHRVDPETAPEDSEAGDIDGIDIEAEADAFAGAFLLPGDEIRTDLTRYGASVAFLAERYGVSEATVRRRLRTLEVAHV